MSSGMWSGCSIMIIVRTWLWFIVEREVPRHKPSRVRFGQPPGSVSAVCQKAGTRVKRGEECML
jgi:hypothetical protein